MKHLNVFYDGHGEHQLVGQLAMDGRQPVFQYHTQWLQQPLPLSPLELPASTQLYRGYETSQYGLPGLIADSLPDGWGMLLMDRFFRKYQHREPYDVSILERLAYIGHSAIGALSFEPESSIGEQAIEMDLLTLAQSTQAVVGGHESDALKSLLIVGGSPQGARPKALVKYDASQGQISTLQTATGEDWLVKFPAQGENQSVCAAEHVYALMAKQCGLDMPESRFFDLGQGYGAFGVKRFDRDKELRIHTHTLAGVLNTNFRLPTLSYTQFLRCIRALTHSEPEVIKGYRQCVFNVVFNNRDDHTKNFSFVMDSVGQWTLSPPYDLSFNTGLNGEHNMDIMGEGKHVQRKHLLALAKNSDIKPAIARDIIEQTVAVANTLHSQLKNYPIDLELNQRICQHVAQNMAYME